MPNKILARPGLLTQLPDTEHHLCQKAITRFAEEGKTHGANLEKPGPNLFSIRANDEVRLILSPIKHNNEQVWVLVKILLNLKKENHNRFANLINTEQRIEITALSAPNPEAQETTLLSIEEDSGIEFHQGQFILQQKNAKEAPLPLLISGAPGSGKSSVSLFLLTQYINPQTMVRTISKSRLVRLRVPLQKEKSTEKQLSNILSDLANKIVPAPKNLVTYRI
jgi:predicted AAA+ superfamily ATPase